ncbi:VOC family protein [Glycomyces salinus]|uniref:VOC family protein n=1 Tax=Glycomyces salinus TaxID=980294 RepID=UPI0018EAD888|nr:VOC family protein [Glycomyces salinus]
MLKGISIHTVFVLDQEEALEFYVGKLGLEVGSDVDFGAMRWLTVRVPGQPDREILLEVPGPPHYSEEIAAQIRDLLTKGSLGAAAILTVDDCQAEYERLVGLGVEFTEKPTQQSYGIDCALRDPFGNHIRMTQLPDSAE